MTITKLLGLLSMCEAEHSANAADIVLVLGLVLVDLPLFVDKGRPHTSCLFCDGQSRDTDIISTFKLDLRQIMYLSCIYIVNINIDKFLSLTNIPQYGNY